MPVISLYSGNGIYHFREIRHKQVERETTPDEVTMRSRVEGSVVPSRTTGAVATSSHFMDFVVRNYFQENKPKRKKKSINKEA